MVSTVIPMAYRDAGVLLPSSVWVSNQVNDGDKVSLVLLLALLLLIPFCLFCAEARQQRIHLGMW